LRESDCNNTRSLSHCFNQARPAISTINDPHLGCLEEIAGSSLALPQPVFFFWLPYWMLLSCIFFSAIHSHFFPCFRSQLFFLPFWFKQTLSCVVCFHSYWYLGPCSPLVIPSFICDHFIFVSRRCSNFQLPVVYTFFKYHPLVFPCQYIDFSVAILNAESCTSSFIATAKRPH